MLIFSLFLLLIIILFLLILLLSTYINFEHVNSLSLERNGSMAGDQSSARKCMWWERRVAKGFAVVGP